MRGIKEIATNPAVHILVGAVLFIAVVFGLFRGISTTTHTDHTVIYTR